MFNEAPPQNRPGSASPESEYEARLAQRRRAFDELSRRDAWLAAARLVVFGAAGVVALLAWRAPLSWWWIAAPTAAFLVLVVWHDRVIRARERAAAAVVFYEHGLARINDRWVGRGAPGDEFLDERHPYANDLDLFGAASVFQLLCGARTRAGEATLAAWLKHAADPPEIAARQLAVRELSPALDLREDLAVSGERIRDQVDQPLLVRWAQAPPGLSARTRIAAGLVTTATLATAAGAAFLGDTTPFLVMLGVQAGFALPLERRVRTILHGADGPARSLTALSPTLQRLERESFAAPRLTALRQRIEERGGTASQAVGHLNRLVEMHDWQHNVVFALIGLVLMWGTHVAGAIEAWRREHGPHVATWLETVGEFEALSSLSAYAYEHPADPYPAVAATDTPACFDGVGLGHPLVPAARMVRNDVHLEGATRLLLVSGSNMSGKSTLLRTVGINSVLAQMGAPVRATALTLSPLRVGATLRIQDSLQEGRSRFYAEITRVRELADLARGHVPVMFLLDELFHGTNSHDRLAGATGVLRSFLERGAIGLVTTHDLALTAMADQLGQTAANVHFEDWFDGGEIRFDYLMKSGPVTRSNALALMRAVGLEVEDTGDGQGPRPNAQEGMEFPKHITTLRG